MLNGSQESASRAAPRTPRQLQGRSKKAQLHIARIAQYIGEQGQASAAQLSALLGLDASRALAQEQAETAKAALASFSGQEAEFLRALAEYTVNRAA